MTDEELAEIELENERRFLGNLICCGSYMHTKRLIAEVRRLKAEVESLKNPPKMPDIARQIEAGGVSPFEL